MSREETEKRIGRPRGRLSELHAQQLDQAADHLAAAERDLGGARRQLAYAIQAAHQAGASTRAIADRLGFSHQRIHQLLRSKNEA